MKRFTLRLADKLHKKFKNYCKERSLTMKAKLVELIKKEMNDNLMYFDVGQLIYLHERAGLPLPAELQEKKNKLYDNEQTEKNKKAQKLMVKKEKGKELTEEEEEFLQNWLDDVTIHNDD